MINLPDVISVARQKPTLLTMPAVINERSKLFSKPVHTLFVRRIRFCLFWSPQLHARLRSSSCSKLIKSEISQINVSSTNFRSLAQVRRLCLHACSVFAIHESLPGEEICNRQSSRTITWTVSTKQNNKALTELNVSPRHQCTENVMDIFDCFLSKDFLEG